MSGPKRAPIYHADCIEIPLTKGRSAFVDLDCPPEILVRNWRVCGRMDYAVTGHGCRMLHRMILGLADDDSLQGDHIDGDPGNNRRANLRVGSSKQNCANRGSYTASSSQFRGVYRSKHKWRSSLQWTTNGKACRRHLGYFDTEIEAARAWDAAALACEHYDPAFLRLNFPDDPR